MTIVVKAIIEVVVAGAGGWGRGWTATLEQGPEKSSRIGTWLGITTTCRDDRSW